MLKYRILFLLIALLLVTAPAANAQTAERPFIMPVAASAGPATWLMGQSYGNTVGAYNNGPYWYASGQGMHFGIDVSMPCGTELVAVADGEVLFVDNLGHGSGPHNLILIHRDLNVVTLYGHLLRAPDLVAGQSVTQGQIVAVSGDPDLTCNSRPHLHFEVRSIDRFTTYNPINFIDVNWHNLVLIGSFGYPLFQQDLANPRRWMSMEDQPNIAFGGATLNNYASTYPPPNNQRPPANALVLRDLTPLPENTTWNARVVTFDSCCTNPSWHPTDPTRFRMIDGSAGTGSALIEWLADGTPATVVESAPPSFTSPDGTLRVRDNGGQVTITRVDDNTAWVVATNGAIPSISPDNSKLLWVMRDGVSVPGSTPPNASIWISDIDGANARSILTDRGIGAQWLDNTRVLLSDSEDRTTTLSVYNTTDGSSFALGSWYLLRGLSAAPGGGRLMFYLPFQEDPAMNGVYVIDTIQSAQATRLSWFGGWQWRDADSVYYIPFEPESATQTLAYYHIPTGANRLLTDRSTLPFTIANGAWDVSPDGRSIIFQSADDRNVWILEYSE